MMFRQIPFFFLLLMLGASCPESTFAQTDSIYSFYKKVSLPGNSGYDYVSLDAINRRLYVSHGTTVDVLDLGTEKYIGSIDSMQGVHGIAIVNRVNKGFISDGRGQSAVAFDLKTLKKIATIPLSKKGPDGIIYDPYSNRVLVFCGRDNSACVIDVAKDQEVATIDLGGGPEFAVSDSKGLVYNNLEDKNSLNVIDTRKMKVIANYALSPCGGPTGIALDDKDHRAFTVCRENKGLSVVDVTNGKVVATIPIGAGVDAVVFDQEYRRIIASNGDGTATVIQQNTPDDYTVVQTLHTPYRAKTMALDPRSHKIYFSAAAFQAGTRNVLPDSFAVWIYQLNK